MVSAETTSGRTCIFLDPSIDVTTLSPVVTGKLGAVVFRVEPEGCIAAGKKGIEVEGTNLNGSLNGTETFSIVVP